MAMSRAAGGSSVTSRSPMRIVPRVTCSRPAISLRSVDLPQPDGPTSTMNSPSAISRSSPRMASKPLGKTLRIPWRVTDAMSGCLFPGDDGCESAIELLLDGHEDGEDGRRADERHEHQPLPLDVPLADVHEHAHGDRLEIRRAGQECDREHELVPADDERVHRRRDQSGYRQRQDDSQQRLEATVAVDAGGLLDLRRDRTEEAGEQPDREGQR